MPKLPRISTRAQSKGLQDGAEVVQKRRSTKLPAAVKPLSVEEEPAEEVKPVKMGIPVIDKTNIVGCCTPQMVAEARIERILGLVGDQLQIIIADIQHILDYQPDRRELYYDLPPELPQDVVAVVIASLDAEGWSVEYDGSYRLLIQLPVVPYVAPPISFAPPSMRPAL